VSTATENKTEFHCSCGRTFAHEISLKRHCWVTGHTAAEGGQEAAAPVAAEVTAAVTPVVLPAPVELPACAGVDVVEEALRIMRAKQQAQQAFELRQERERQVREAVACATTIVQQSVAKVSETTRQGAEVVRTSTMLAMRMLLMILVCLSLVGTGMGLGRLMAAPADASTVSVRTLPAL
jgi:hypothetical protein